MVAILTHHGRGLVSGQITAPQLLILADVGEFLEAAQDRVSTELAVVGRSRGEQIADVMLPIDKPRPLILNEFIN